MKSMTLLKLKNELKLTADLIKQKKPIFRQAVSVTTKAGGDTSWHNKELGAIEAELAKLRFDFRHRHIVYCLIRGRTREQIEKRVPCKPVYGKCEDNPHCCNKPSEKKIHELLNHYTQLIAEETKEVCHETVCASAG